MQKRLLLLIVFLSLFLGFKAQTYPVQVTSILNPPNSVYLEDYSATGSNSWGVFLTLLDLAEPSREVYLRLSIESNNVSLKTKPNYIPIQDIITIYPGTPLQLSGSDLAPYINQQAMSAVGITWQQIQQNGRLPEDFYSFCVEVVDYISGEILSENKCQGAWIKLNDQPILNNPLCGNVIDATLPTSLAFQWQSINLLSPNSLNSTEYQLTVFEITNPNLPPQNALNNGDVIQVFQTQWQTNSFYLYTIADPAFESGKGYYYTVQARDNSGRDLFKNNGFSEPCWFWYGYPEGGNITLTSPSDSSAFTKYAPQYFEWEAPQNLIANQGVQYELKIVEVNEDINQTKEDALGKNAVWHSKTFPVSYTGNGRDFELNKSIKAFEKGKRYAWIVIAKTANQTIAESEAYTFMGPPLVDEFFVNNKKVTVTELTTNDIHNLSGSGLVSLDQYDSVQVAVTFNNINLTTIAGLMFLESGDVNGVLEEDFVIDIIAHNTENGNAKMYANKLNLNVNSDLRLYGNIEWELPLVVDSYDTPYVYSKNNWFRYFNYRLTAVTEFALENEFELLDPYDFRIDFEETSTFVVLNNEFDINFNGSVDCPESVKSINEDLRVKAYFENQSQLFYMNGTTQNLYSKIIPVGTTNIRINPTDYFIDFSDFESPLRHQDDETWKGLYINEYDLLFAPTVYENSNIQFRETINEHFKLADNDSSKVWITSQGLDFVFKEQFNSNEGLTFNTFEAKVNQLEIEVEQSIVSNSRLLGSLKIPFFSDTEEFTFTVPFSEDGYNQAFLDETLEGRSFIFNEGNGQQEISLNINRAVFVDNSKLLMNIDVSWPFFQVQLDNLDGLTLWGNYDVGFVTPNGNVPLINQVTGVSNDYDITVDYIGAGRDANLYSLGVSGTMMMGDDISGDDGAPIFSGYSTSESPLIPENYQPYTNSSTPYQLPEYTQPGQGESNGVEFAEGDKDNEVNHAVNLFSNYLDNMSGTSFNENNNSYDNIDEIFEEEQEEESGVSPELVLEKLIQLIDIISPFLKEEKRSQAVELKNKLEDFSDGEILIIYNEIKENGFNLNRILKAQIDKITNKINDKIIAEMDTINNKIRTTVLKPVDKLLLKVNTFIDDKLTQITDRLIEKINNENATNVIEATRENAIATITAELSRSVYASVDSNILNKIITNVDTIFTQKVTRFIKVQVTDLGYKIIDKDINSVSFNAIADSLKGKVREIGSEVVQVFKTVSFQVVKNTCGSVVEDAYEGIDWQMIGDNIKNDLLNNLEDEALNIIAGELTDLIGNQFAGDVIQGLTANVDFDFSNLGQKMKDGDLSGVVSFNPTKIKIRSKVADIDGLLEFTKDDPLWGDSWQAMINASIKKPKDFNVNGRFLNGKVDGFNYWFFEIGVPSGLNVPMFAGLNLDGIGGKVFKCMRYNYNNQTYLPDSLTKYGVGVNLYIVDAATMGTSTRMNVTAEVTVLENYFTMEIRGDVGMAFPDDEYSTPFTQAVANGNGVLAYNSNDKTLIGQFNAQTNLSPLLCANGEMGLHVSPGYWNFYLGKENSPMTAKVLCLDAISMKSWLEIDNQGLDIGLQADINVWARSPWFKIGRYWRPYAGFEFHFLSTIAMQFKPNVKLEEALVYVYLNAEVGVDWEKRNSDGDVNSSGNMIFVGAYLEGEVHYVNRPTEAYLYGSLAGRLTILTIGIGFGLEIDKDLTD